MPWITAVSLAVNAAASEWTPNGTLLAEPIRAQYVIIISIDGWRPATYLDPVQARNTPTIQEIRRAGSFATRVAPPYPSLTYVGHADISTGVRPIKHGVAFGNNKHPINEPDRGAWFASDLKAPALWDRVAAAGLTTAALSWPTTAGATNITWNFPEFWSSPLGSELSMVRKYATPALLAMADRIYRRRWHEHLSSADRRDALLCRLAEELIVRHRPNLLMIHFVETDKTQHRHGPHSSQSRDALERVDDLIKRLRDAVNRAGLSEKTAWLLVGDHGFADVEFALAPNVLLAEHGFLHVVNDRVDAWKAVVVNSGGSAGVYLSNPADRRTARSVRALLEAKSTDEHGRAYYRVIDRAELNDLGAAPGASFYLEGEPGYMFSAALSGPFLRRSSLRGQHGYLPSRPAMHTGFIAAGAGIKRGVVIDDMHLIDVAPTAAALLGVSMPRADGRVLREIMQ
jgi:predicted AlkP superfamily pyrophosphatase or phosphodiesterase